MNYLLAYGGLVLGSFLYCLVGQCLSPEPRDWWRRSSCDHCQHTLRWTDLIPILNWCLNRGRCAYCSCPLPWSYLGVEVACAGLVIWSRGQTWEALGIAWLLYLMSLCDLSQGWVPDCLQGLLLVLVLFYSRNTSPTWWFVGLVCLLLLTLGLAFPHAIGGADLKLLFTLSLLIPPSLYPKLLFLSSLLGLGHFASSYLKEEDPLHRIPFVPYLALATWWLLA